jgi:lauroyl/myristoyl acyltransferase
MVRTGDRQQDTITNTRRLAVVVEGYVRAHPEQWMMFHPVW